MRQAAAQPDCVPGTGAGVAQSAVLNDPTPATPAEEVRLRARSAGGRWSTSPSPRSPWPWITVSVKSRGSSFVPVG